MVSLYTDSAINGLNDKFAGASGTVLTNLELLNNMLEAYETEEDVTLDEINRLVAMVDELSQSLMASAMSGIVKNRLIETLAVLRSAIQRVNLIGPEAMLDNVDKMLGQMTQLNLVQQTEAETAEARGFSSERLTSRKVCRKSLTRARNSSLTSCSDTPSSPLTSACHPRPDQTGCTI